MAAGAAGRGADGVDALPGSAVMMLTGGIEDVIRAYEGEEAARHVAEIVAETARAR